MRVTTFDSKSLTNKFDEVLRDYAKDMAAVLAKEYHDKLKEALLDKIVRMTLDFQLMDFGDRQNITLLIPTEDENGSRNRE